MRLKLSLRKILAVTATLATLINSLGAPMSVLAQEVTPTPIPIDNTTPTPTDSTTLTASPTAQPTNTPDASPTEIATPSPEVTPVPTDSVTPVPTDQPVSNDQNSNSNVNSQGPPESPTVSPSATPTATPSTPVEHGTLSETLLTGIDLSGITDLNSNVVGSGSISTNQSDYSPTSLVLISGSGFIANKDYTIEIVSTDQPPVDFTDHVKADSTGSISYSYQLDGISRPNYTIYIKDGENIVATATFTDPVNPATTVDQCQNGGIGNTLQPCNQTPPNAASSGYGYQGNANANGNNSHWYEGDFVPIRIIATNYATGSGNIQFEIDVTKGGKHAYDYIGSFDATETTGASNTIHANHNNPVGDIISGDSPTAPDGTGTIPSASLSSFPAACGSNTFTGSQVSGAISAWGTSGPLNVTYVSQNVGSSGNCSTTIQVAWTGTKAGFGGTIVLAYGAHIATQGDWGTGNSAVNISGSPYHTSLIQSTTGGNTSVIGSQETKLAANSIVVTPVIATTPNPTSGNIGVTLNDTATLTNGIGNNGPTGTITFKLFPPSDTSCAGTPSYTQIVNVSNSSASTSPGFVSNLAGTWHWSASYSGDSNNNPVISACSNEPVTINSLTPTVTTQIHNASHSVITSATVGDTVHDYVTVSGSNGTPTGTVYLKWFNNSACTGDAAATSSNISLSSGSFDATGFPQTATAGGNSFKAHYNGDNNYLAGDGSCESLTVNKAQLGISTTVHSDNPDQALTGNLSLGSGAHDSATVTGKVDSLALPNVTFYFFGKGVSCTNGSTTGGTLLNTVTPDSSGVAHPSTSETGLAAGTYNFMAVVAGNDNYLGKTSDCEPFTVDKAQLGISTTVHSDNPDQALTGNLTAGDGAHDSASVSGKINSFSLPNVTFYFFGKGVSCTNGSTSGATTLNTLTPDGTGVAHPSTSETNLAAGNYNFMATVAGNDNYIGTTSNCEPFTVGAASPSIVTSPNPAGPVVLGTVLNDSATLSGGFNPIGTILFSLYGPSDPTCTGTAAFTNSVSVNGNGPYSTSSGFAAIVAGVWNWIAAFTSSNSNNSNISGTCGQEPVSISKANTNVTTHVHDVAHKDITNTAIDLGSVVHDNATVSGQIGSTVITGTLTYKFFNNDTCTGDPISTQGSVALGNESSPTSALGAGSYGYLASYSGDSNYNGSTGSCEPFTVNKAQLGITTAAHDSSHTDITNGSVALGSIVHDTATLSGVVNGFAVPTPAFTLTTNYTDSCANGSAVGNDGTDSGNGGYKSSNSAALGAGHYAYMATVEGNSNYIGAGSSCEPFNVNKTQLGIGTTVHSDNPDQALVGNLTLGSGAHDSASVTGQVGSFTLPDVTFYFFGKGVSCTNGDTTGGTQLNTVSPVSGTAHPSTSETGLAAGSYNFMAVVSGNSNYLGATSDCEPFTVDKAQLSIDTIVHNASHADITNGSVGAGSIVHDTASVSGTVKGFDFPTPTFTLTSNYTDSCANGSAVGNDGTDSGNGGFKSSDSAQLNAGDYAYMASVAGNDNYLGAGSDCEPFSVGAITPRFSTTPTASPSPVLGATISDTATITGFNPTGTILFTLYHSLTDSDPCSGDPVTLVNPEVNVSGNNTYRGPSYSPVLAGFWNWIASYSGDANNNKVTGNCGDEQIEIPKSTPTVTTEVKDSQGHVIGVNGETLDFNVNDSATVTGVESVPPTGNVTFTFFDNNTCARDTGTGAGTIALDNNGVASPANETLTQAGKYSFQAHYNGDNNYNAATSDCEPFTLSTLQIDKNTLGGNATFNFTSADSPTNIDKDVQTTGGAGTSGLIPVLSGDYSLSETPLTGWTLASSNCGVEVSPDSFTIDAGKSATCTFNNEKDGTVTVTKYNDTDKDGIFNNDEQVLSDWTINLGKSSDDTGENGQVIFDNVVPGSYQLSEDLQPGWIQTNIQCFYGNERPGTLTEDGYFVNVGPGDNINCFIGNFQPRKSIEIVKSNDKSGGASAGDTVTYTLVVTNTGDVNIPNVDVTDILPGGFTYVDNSATVNGNPQNPNISGNVLSWDIGTVTTETPVTIVYKVKIDGSESNGTYTNYASCREVTTENPTAFLVLAQPAVCETVHSDVPIGGVTFGGHLGQVLGISTELPATGSPTILLIISLGLIGTGLYLGRYNSKKGAKRHAKN